MQIRKNKKTNFLKLGILLFGISLFFSNCENQEENLINQNDASNPYQNISEEEGSQFITNFTKKNSEFRRKTTNSINIDQNSLTFVKVDNSNLSLPVFSVETEPTHISKVFLIKKEGNINAYLYNTFPFKKKSSKEFSGNIIITTINGEFINGYKVIDGLYVSQFRKKKQKKEQNKTHNKEVADPFRCIDYGTGLCNQTLDEIVIRSEGGGSYRNFRSPSIFIFPPRGPSIRPILNSSGSSRNNGGGNSNENSNPGSSPSVPLFPCGDSLHGCQKTPCPNGNGYQDYYGNCIEEDDQIINELTGKAKCLNDSLTKKGNSFVKNLLANFEGESEFDINISSKDKIYSKSRKSYVNGQTSYKNGDKTIYITISEDKISNEPVLSGIRTILHEYIHADIFRKLNTKYNTQDGIKDFKKTYEKYELEKHHNSMASLYINSMTKSLKEIHKNILSREYDYLSNNGSKSLDDLYEALAWQGLKNHKLDAWKELGQDTTRMNTALTTYYHSLTKTCPK